MSGRTLSWSAVAVLRSSNSAWSAAIARDGSLRMRVMGLQEQTQHGVEATTLKSFMIRPPVLDGLHWQRKYLEVLECKSKPSLCQPLPGRLLDLSVTRGGHRSTEGVIMRQSSRRVLEVAVLAALVYSGPTYAQTASPNGDPGQDRQDMRHDRRDLRQDRQDVQEA